MFFICFSVTSDPYDFLPIWYLLNLPIPISERRLNYLKSNDITQPNANNLIIVIQLDTYEFDRFLRINVNRF